MTHFNAKTMNKLVVSLAHVNLVACVVAPK